MLSDSPENDPILDRHGDIWDPVRLLDPLVLGDYDFRNALPIAPQLLLQLAQAIIDQRASTLLALDSMDSKRYMRQ